ncbi:MAG TPA: TIGR01458 family HAD-type hydrolase [Burkholderiales bacterium]|nr:TIGR01458 family HAD-type hydrolase [Burkholderiales bacterium]
MGKKIEGLLLDIDGVLTVSWRALPGAVAALETLRALGLPMRFLTNTTSRTRAAIAQALDGQGFRIAASEILTAPAATATYLRKAHPGQRCYLLSSGDVAAELQGVKLVGEKDPADVVVLGGAGPEFSYEHLNHAFHLLCEGAALVAMHRNMLWRTEGGLDLDAGAYVSGLEKAANRQAEVVGKPSRLFYGAALAALGTPASRTLMVGDDIEADITGAQAADIRAVLVRTGKFRESDLARAPAPPDAVIDSIVDLPAWLASQR